MDDTGVVSPVPADGQDGAGSSLLAAVLVLSIFGLVGLLTFSRDALAIQVLPGLSVYLIVLVGLTLFIWGLSWMHMLRVRRVQQGDGVEGAA